MKSWAIIATIFLIASLCLNVWYYREAKNLNSSIRQQNEDLEFGSERDSEYRLPFEAIYELWSKINTLVNSVLGHSTEHSQLPQQSDILGDDKPVTAATHNLTISINGQGSISPGEGEYEYPSGTQVAINVSPIFGWDFDHWSGDATGTSPTIIITMDSDRHVTAYFEDPNSPPEQRWCTGYGCN